MPVRFLFMLDARSRTHERSKLATNLYTNYNILIIKHKEFYLQKTWQKFCRFKNLLYLCNR